LPSVPAAPGRFSITTGCPSLSCIAWATMRPMMSAPPPGPNGTITRIDRCGQSCAVASTVPASSAAPDRAKSPRRVNIIPSLGRKPEHVIVQAAADFSLFHFYIGLSQSGSGCDCRACAVRDARQHNRESLQSIALRKIFLRWNDRFDSIPSKKFAQSLPDGT
jgi:hypothetical protein